MAFDINHVTVVGRLTRDPELSYTNNQTPVCKFSIANGRGTSAQSTDNDVSFFDITTWNKTATNCAQFLKKGRQVAIEGRLSQSRWKDKTTGQGRSKVEIIANMVQFIGGNDNQSYPQTNAAQGQGIQQGQPSNDIPIPEPEWNNGAVNEGDVPF